MNALECCELPLNPSSNFHTDLPALKTKSEMFGYYEKGWFGNRALTWPTKDEMLKSGYPGQIGLRYKDPRGGGSYFRTEMSLEEAEQQYSAWLLEGAQAQYFLWCESIPTNRILIQGEFQRSLSLYDFTYTTEKGVPNRPNLWKQKQNAHGLRALLLCKHFMWPKSYDNLQELLDLYPEAVIEFSCVDFECGSIPGHNTIFWEVRHY